jgi:hypothetical protein
MSMLNMASLYRNADQKFHPEFELYNINDSTLRIYLKFSPGELLFIRQGDDRFSATLGVHCRIIGSYESAKLIDSASSSFTPGSCCYPTRPFPPFSSRGAPSC